MENGLHLHSILQLPFIHPFIHIHTPMGAAAIGKRRVHPTIMITWSWRIAVMFTVSGLDSTTTIESARELSVPYM